MPKPECIICYKKINKKIEMNLTILNVNMIFTKVVL